MITIRRCLAQVGDRICEKFANATASRVSQSNHLPHFIDVEFCYETDFFDLSTPVIQPPLNDTMLSRSALNRSSLLPLRSTVAMAPKSLVLARHASTMRPVATPRLISMAGSLLSKRSMSTKRREELYSPEGLKKPLIPRLIKRLERLSGDMPDDKSNKNLPRTPSDGPPSSLAKLTPEEKQDVVDYLLMMNIRPARRIELFTENARDWRRWKAEFCVFYLWSSLIGTQLGILSWQISNTDTYKKLQKWWKKVTGRAVSEQEEREKRVQD